MNAPGRDNTIVLGQHGQHLCFFSFTLTIWKQDDEVKEKKESGDRNQWILENSKSTRLRSAVLLSEKPNVQDSRCD